jgi:hypothetical protein
MDRVKSRAASALPGFPEFFKIMEQTRLTGKNLDFSLLSIPDFKKIQLNKCIKLQ